MSVFDLPAHVDHPSRVFCRTCAGCQAEDVVRLQAEIEQLRKALDGLCAWLLHRFGPDTPEGREATCRLADPLHVEKYAPAWVQCSTCDYRALRDEGCSRSDCPVRPTAVSLSDGVNGG